MRPVEGHLACRASGAVRGALAESVRQPSRAGLHHRPGRLARGGGLRGWVCERTRRRAGDAFFGLRLRLAVVKVGLAGVSARALSASREGGANFRPGFRSRAVECPTPNPVLT